MWSGEPGDGRVGGVFLSLFHVVVELKPILLFVLKK
jgi:hypothetical protein